ncbi:MAG: hypothetical protein ACRELE_04890, partial [Gemmatimonadales bacterium]
GEASFVEALRHLIDADDSRQINEATASWVRQRRAAGDDRSGSTIIRDLLGATVDSGIVARIVASLPNRLRHRRWFLQPAWPAGVTVGAMAVAILWWTGKPRSRPDAELGFFVGPESTAVQRMVSVSANGWERSRADLPAVGATDASTRFPAGLLNISDAPAPSPDGRQWLVSRRVSGELGPTELKLIDSTGREQPVAPAHGDDVTPDWAPDGRSAVFVTTRWSPRNNATFNLGILDLDTRAVRRLTAGAASDQRPRWSPDGTRIAFLRQPAPLAPSELCWVTVDGKRQWCRTFGQDIQDVVGWLDRETVLAVVGIDASHGALARVRLDDSTMTKLASGVIDAPALSPNGRWLACRCEFPEMLPGVDRIVVFPVGQADQRRLVAASGGAPVPEFFWHAGSGRRWLASIHLAAPVRSIAVAESYRMFATGVLSDGAKTLVPADVVEWQSSNPTVVSVDTSTGDLRPRSPGFAWITVSAGGWRRDSVRVDVAGAAPVRVTTENWGPSWPDRWAVFGRVPLPQVIMSPLIGSAITPNGDGTYDNGVYTRQRFSATAGLGVEATVQSPVNRSKWQRIGLSLSRIEPITDSVPTGAGCSERYPSGEGWMALHEASGPGTLFRMPDAFATGTPYRLRVQLFPDGSCGVAINGRVVVRSKQQWPTDQTYGVIVIGESVGTKMLVGQLTIWQGVRADMDWDALARVPAAASQIPNHH